MNTQEREALKRAAATLRNELRNRQEHGWEKISAREALDVMLGAETGSELEREAWRVVAEMRERAKRRTATPKWLTDRLAEHAEHWERTAEAPNGGELTRAEHHRIERIARREPLKLDPDLNAALRDILTRVHNVIPAARLTMGGGSVSLRDTTIGAHSTWTCGIRSQWRKRSTSHTERRYGRNTWERC